MQARKGTNAGRKGTKVQHLKARRPQKYITGNRSSKDPKAPRRPQKYLQCCSFCTKSTNTSKGPKSTKAPTPQKHQHLKRNYKLLNFIITYKHQGFEATTSTKALKAP
jgi:hypothetical protein